MSGKRKVFRFPGLLAFGIALLFFPFHRAAAEENVEGARTAEGFVVKKGAYVAIPDDMQMKRVGKNVIKPEEEEFYVARKIEALQDQLSETERKLQQRLDIIAKNLESIQESLSEKKKSVVF